MNKLVFADPFQRPTPPRQFKADAEDRYYRSCEPRRFHRFLPVASIAAIVGFLVLTFDLPR